MSGRLIDPMPSTS